VEGWRGVLAFWKFVLGDGDEVFFLLTLSVCDFFYDFFLFNDQTMVGMAMGNGFLIFMMYY